MKIDQCGGDAMLLQAPHFYNSDRGLVSCPMKFMHIPLCTQGIWLIDVGYFAATQAGSLWG